MEVLAHRYRTAATGRCRRVGAGMTLTSICGLGRSRPTPSPPVIRHFPASWTILEGGPVSRRGRGAARLASTYLSMRSPGRASPPETIIMSECDGLIHLNHRRPEVAVPPTELPTTMAKRCRDSDDHTTIALALTSRRERSTPSPSSATGTVNRGRLRGLCGGPRPAPRTLGPACFRPSNRDKGQRLPPSSTRVRESVQVVTEQLDGRPPVSGLRNTGTHWRSFGTAAARVGVGRVLGCPVRRGARPHDDSSIVSAVDQRLILCDRSSRLHDIRDNQVIAVWARATRPHAFRPGHATGRSLAWPAESAWCPCPTGALVKPPRWSNLLGARAAWSRQCG